MAARGTGVYISPVYLNANKSEGLSSDSDSSSLKDDEENSVEHQKSRGRGSWERGVPAGCHVDLALHGYAGPRSTLHPPPPPPPPPPKPHQHVYQQCNPVACTLHDRTVPYARLSLDVTPSGPGYPAKDLGRRSVDALSPFGHQLQHCSFDGLPPLGSNMPRSSITVDTAFYAASQHPCVGRSSRSSLESTAHRSSIDLAGHSSADFVGHSSIDLMAARDFNRAMSLQDRVSFEAMHSTPTDLWFSSQQHGSGCNNQQACAGNTVTCMLQNAALSGQPPAAVDNSSQLYNQQQQSSMQTAASAMSRNLSAPLPATQSPNCVQYTPIAQQHQRVAGCMSSPQPSGEYLCMMRAPGHNSMAGLRCSSSSSNCLAAQHISSTGSTRASVQPVLSAIRPYSNSFTAGRTAGAVQQQQLDLAAGMGGMGSCLSSPLPGLLPPQQHQQHQQQQYLSAGYVPIIPEQQQLSADTAMDATIQEMLLKELQLQELVAGVAASNQGTPIPSPTLHTPPPPPPQQQQQQCGFTGAVSVTSNGRAGAIPAGIQLADPVISVPLMGLCDAAPDESAGLCASGVGNEYVNCANSNMLLLQQQQLQASQQLPSAAAALVCSKPLLSPAATMQQQEPGLCVGRSSAQMKLQQLAAVQQWQHSIEEELLQLLPMA